MPGVGIVSLYKRHGSRSISPEREERRPGARDAAVLGCRTKPGVKLLPAAKAAWIMAEQGHANRPAACRGYRHWQSAPLALFCKFNRNSISSAPQRYRCLRHLSRGAKLEHGHRPSCSTPRQHQSFATRGRSNFCHSAWQISLEQHDFQFRNVTLQTAQQAAGAAATSAATSRSISF